ncbi:hypothetical protein RND81_07G057700 [Saponaria officinalis]|uniref:CRM domain-containing protein n=1 Tax=Saponaria officinalis TaxID=3572 RepID=A0AAW1JPC1_SAPOF
MAGILQNSHPLLKPSSSSSSSSSSFTSLPLNPHSQFFLFTKPFNFRTNCLHNTTEQLHNNPIKLQQQQQLQINTDEFPKKQKTKRKPKPSFYEQISEKWSVKPISNTKKLPWQLQKQELIVGNDENLRGVVSVGESFNLFGQVVSNGSKIEEPSSSKMVEMIEDKREIVSGVESFDLFGGVAEDEPVFDSVRNVGVKTVSSSFDNTSNNSSLFDEEYISVDNVEKNRMTLHGLQNDGYSSSSSLNVEDNTENYVRKFEEVIVRDNVEDDFAIDNGLENGVRDNFENCVRESSVDRLPWMGEKDDKEEDNERRRRSKTELAEKTIPEHELKRLRNVALRMKERIKVGDAGVTQAVVDEIHEKWKIDEVVKLKFEGPPAFHMKRTHEVLESKTGGLVIWRSGSSVVLYRGLAYKFNCVNTYIKKGETSNDSPHAQNSAPDSVSPQKNMSPKELKEMSEVDSLLDGLGLRFLDWSGPPPLPVDADLLPGVVPGYKTPFRLLPHGVKRTLKDSEITKIRRQARFMRSHFALGRNRELQGLAAAMVKLWEKSALAKIAIKRGVLNTRNERMAEELKRLTGGTLLSRNKEFIVFYRGNDFMPPRVTESLKEREKLTLLQYEEEEVRRYGATLVSVNPKKSKVPLVAGTLAETVAATSRWGKLPNGKEIDKMMKDSAVARRASLVRYLQNKQAIANRKLRKAEKALVKVQKYLIPEELPTDLETITDEERLVFRKMGLSMKPFLLLGRREVFAGTIENMHLHWKFRELVKIIVSGKSFAQVKHIAISLEAESGGVLVSIDKTLKGYIIIFYRGKNYRRPVRLKPRNLLTRRQALARSIELQRLEGLKHHMSSLREQMELVQSELEDLEDGKELDDKTFYEKLDDSVIPSDDEMEEEEDEEAYLLTYDSRDGRSVV